jgi:hypothetical protein
MSTGLKRNWTEGDTWRSVAYLYYRNSLQYKYLLALNPSFDIRYVPSPNVTVNATGEVFDGLKQPQALGPLQGAQGQLRTVDTVLNLSNTAGQAGNYPPVGTETIYPFNSYVNYADALGGYTAAALLDADRINGLMLDSDQAFIDPIGSYDPSRRYIDAVTNRVTLSGESVLLESTQQAPAAVAATSSSGATESNTTYTTASSSGTSSGGSYSPSY